MGSADVFKDVFSLVSFFSALWMVGKLSTRLGLPSLVGEIVTGIILGPNFLDLVPKHGALKIFGDIGLLLLVLEAGIDVNMGVLKIVGSRGLMIAIFGSLFPLAIGSFLAYLIRPTVAIAEAIAIGACFAPTSMGIALNVLRNGKVLNTPTGQLIIAAAILDDVIALMLLSVLQELSKPDPSTIDILIPILTSPILILIFGFIAVKISPPIIKSIMDKIDIKYHEYAILFMLFSSMLILVPCCFFAKSSYLLGGFLSGLMFCTDHTIHHVWEKQMQKIMHWLLRIFFACTIAFEVPIKDFANPEIIINAMIYFTAVLGKMATGFFAPGKPIDVIEFFTISFSMSAWGEFAFILATSAYNDGIFGKDTLSEILLAVLLSVILSPLLLRITLKTGQKKKVGMIKLTRKQTVNTLRLTTDGKSLPDTLTSFDDSTLGSKASIDSVARYTHFVYYCIHTKTFGKWGHQDRLLRGLYSLKLEIIDFRAFNEPQDNYSHDTPYVEDVFYVKDTELSLVPSKQLSIVSQRKLSKRVHVIKYAIKDALEDKGATIEIMRWLPGIKRTEADDLELQPPKLIRRVSVSYVRDEAYREARLALSRAQLHGWEPPRSIDFDDDAVRTPSARLPKLKRTTSEGPQILHTPINYLSRIRSENDIFGSRSKKISHRNLDILDEEHDDLVKLNTDSAMDLHKRSVSADLSTDSTSIRLDILHTDDDGTKQKMLTTSRSTGLTSGADHKTPLLKRKT